MSTKTVIVALLIIFPAYAAKKCGLRSKSSLTKLQELQNSDPNMQNNSRFKNRKVNTIKVKGKG